MSTRKTGQEIIKYFKDNEFETAISDGNGANIEDFLQADQARQDAILDSTQILITEEEFCHAKRWLALAYITGGEHFSDENGQEINHKTVYQQQEILPADGIPISGADIAQKMDSVIPHITAEHVKKLYKRLVEKRPKFFVSKDDTTEEVRSHENHITKNQTVKLKEYISYAEMDFCSSLLQVSGDVNFVNDGNRDNIGTVKSGGGEYEEEGRIAGLVGARFEVGDAMEPTNLMVGVYNGLEVEHSTALLGAANKRANFGRIQSVNKEFVEGHKKIWDEFYKNQNSANDAFGLLNDRLQQRLYISYKKFFADAIADAKATNKKAHIRVVGLGDGAWANGKNIQVGKAIGKAVASILKELSDKDKEKIDTIEFCDHGNENYIKGFEEAGGKNFKGVIKVENNQSAPFSNKLPKTAGEQKKLYVCFAWDSASYVGNEYWLAPPNYFGASGDPAAAACSSIPISMNPELNSQFLEKIKVVKSQGCEIVDISDTSLNNNNAKFSKSPEAIMAVASGVGGAGTEFTAPAPAVAGFVDTEAEKQKQKNLQTLQDIYGSSNVVFITRENNFFIRFRTQKEAEDHSEELFQRKEFKIAGGNGKKNFLIQFEDGGAIYDNRDLPTDKGSPKFFGIILISEDVKKIQEKNEKDLEDFQKREDKKKELLKGLKEKGLEVRHNQKPNGELEFFVTLKDGLGGVDVKQVQKSLEDKMKSFLIKGVGGNDKVLVPLNADGNIIYSSTKFIGGDAGRPEYDYSSLSIRKFAIILTQENADQLLTLEDSQINLLKIEAKTDTEFLPPRVPVPPAHAPAPVAHAAAPAPRAAAAAHAPAAAPPPASAPPPVHAQHDVEILGIIKKMGG